MQAANILNINIGILGHVDSGKTSLVRSLSTLISTNALDKNPQSKERGITLDLGFTAFLQDIPEHLQHSSASESSESGSGSAVATDESLSISKISIDETKKYEKVQYTLVDCPGHASLIRTIIGGSQIIDRMILVIDIVKGIQTQTSECLVIGEILTDDMIVVLNKVDLVPADKREERIAKMTDIVRKALANTRFSNCPIIPVSACVGGAGKGTASAASSTSASGSTSESSSASGKGEKGKNQQQERQSAPAIATEGINILIETIRSTTKVPNRNDKDPSHLHMSIDHCFLIKGSGTVLTGTLLKGSVRIGDNVELPFVKVERKVKSIQMFHRPVEVAEQGDRAAICVTNLDPSQIERTIVCSPGTIRVCEAVVALVRKVKYYAAGFKSGSKLHVTVGHSTVLATITLCGSKELKKEALNSIGKRIPDAIDMKQFTESEWEYDPELLGGGKAVGGPFLHLAIIHFESPVLCPNDATLIGAKLDAGVESHACRIALYGRVVGILDEAQSATASASTQSQNVKTAIAQKCKVFKRKEKTGAIERISSETSVIASGLFKKDTDISRFVGLICETESGERGKIEGSFGKSGKFKIEFEPSAGKDVDKSPSPHKVGEKLYLRFKKYIYQQNSNQQNQGKKFLSQDY